MKQFLSAIVLSSALLAAPMAHAGNQDRAMATGAVVGATTGAVVGSSTNQAVQGAFVGAVFGTIAGAILASASEPEYVVVREPHREYREQRREADYRYTNRERSRYEYADRHREPARNVAYREHRGH